MMASGGAATFRPYGVTLPAIAAVGMAMGLWSWSVDNTSYDTWGGVLVAIAVTAVSLPVVVYLARREQDPRVARLLPWALGLKLGSSVVRYAVAFGVYDGASDADSYHRAAELLAPAYRQGDFSADLGRFIGTGFMKGLTGVLYAITGPTKVGGFVVYSAIGFWGLYLFYRAFCLACPEGDHWRYARLVFLLPSLLFWPSSIGKEAWMTLALGLAAYAGSRILSRKRAGFVLLALGLAAMVAVRPHVAGILLVSLVVAYLLRRPPPGGSVLGPIAKIVGLVVLGLVLVVVVRQTQDLFGVNDQFDSEAVSSILERTRAQTSEAGSVFESGNATNRSPSQFPRALVSVLFRPFPWEARNPLAFVAALEGLTLLILFVVCWRRLMGAVRSVLRTPYVVLCLCYSVLFVFGFSSFSNFGILTRQRIQVLPFLLVLLALPEFHRKQEGWKGLLLGDPTGGADPPVPQPVPFGTRQ